MCTPQTPLQCQRRWASTRRLSRRQPPLGGDLLTTGNRGLKLCSARRHKDVGKHAATSPSASRSSSLRSVAKFLSLALSITGASRRRPPRFRHPPMPCAPPQARMDRSGSKDRRGKEEELDPTLPPLAAATIAAGIAGSSAVTSSPPRLPPLNPLAPPYERRLKGLLGETPELAQVQCLLNIFLGWTRLTVKVACGRPMKGEGGRDGHLAGRPSPRPFPWWLHGRCPEGRSHLRHPGWPAQAATSAEACGLGCCPCFRSRVGDPP
uniref:Uncharacterized protein n=1 Tax=Setaria viridis TaxID=4556 RepID=A0A4U6UIJ3_SETVI|nr:hypothetical protein SEVIR_5G113200v2 [Setaria viridis]